MKTVVLPKRERLYHLKCSNNDCEAVMECKKAELQFVHDQRDGNAYVLKCPHCKETTWFSDIEKYVTKEGGRGA